jgi:ABC-type microcin C transport system duplicated ATPase subunit YejF
MTALDPVYTIGDQIAETVMQHEGASRKAEWTGRWNSCSTRRRPRAAPE